MALSRIWAAFIIVAILAATMQAIFVPDNLGIFSRMINGSSGDTSRTHIVQKGAVPDITLHQIEKTGIYADGTTIYQLNDNKEYIRYYRQNADGVIGTSKTAVDISINLIGIMALFMGFMSIAEQAGGIRLLSRIIGPFFSRCFLSYRKAIPQWDIW